MVLGVHNIKLLAHHRRVKRALDFDVVWVVDDPSVVVPDGTRALPRRTADWYEALASARAYVSNAGAPYWFEKKPAQVIQAIFSNLRTLAHRATIMAAMMEK